MNNNESYVDIFNYRGAAYNKAMHLQPDAREAERQALIDLLNLQPGDSVCDVPAGGGYLADGISRDFKNIDIICVEPSHVFSGDICSAHQILNNPLNSIDKPDGSFSVIASLAGLHHTSNRESIFREWGRLLNSEGRIVVADVGAGTGTGEFLNTFVDEHCPSGHVGWFFEAGEFTDLLETDECTNIQERLMDVPWRFASREAMADFCAHLFYLPEVNHQNLIEALEDIVGVVSVNNHSGVELQWQLRYALGER